MGLCHSIDEDEYSCNICNDLLNEKYILCDHCNKRYHYKCLIKYCPSLNQCIYCNSTNISQICVLRNSFNRT